MPACRCGKAFTPRRASMITCHCGLGSQLDSGLTMREGIIVGTLLRNGRENRASFGEVPTCGVENVGRRTEPGSVVDGKVNEASVPPFLSLTRRWSRSTIAIGTWITWAGADVTNAQPLQESVHLLRHKPWLVIRNQYRR